MSMWEERYSQHAYAYGKDPNDFVVEVAVRIPAGGRVLCIAEGEGRNAVYLASRGHEVHTIDGSAAGVRKTQRLAAERGVTVHARHRDLADADLGRDWQAIVAIFAHLPQPLRAEVHQRCVAALAPGGVMLLEAYTPRQLARKTGGPPVLGMLMEPADLRQELAGLTFERLEEKERDVTEGRFHHGVAAVVQVIGVKPA